jgi:hypothetical protein
VPEVMPTEVFDSSVFNRRGESLLQILNRLPGVRSFRVREDERAVAPLSPQPLKSRIGGFIERQGERLSTLRTRHAHYTIQPVDPFPPEAQQVAPAQARIDGEFNCGAQVWRSLDLVRLIQQLPELFFGEVSKPSSVGAEKLHTSKRILDRQALLNAPIEETSEYLKIPVDASLLDLLGPLQLHSIDHRRRDASDHRVTWYASFPHLERGLGVRLVARNVHLRVRLVQVKCSAERDSLRRLNVPRSVLDLVLFPRPEAQCIAFAPELPPQTGAVWVSDFNEPSTPLLIPNWSLREVATPSSFVHCLFSL